MIPAFFPKRLTLEQNSSPNPKVSYEIGLLANGDLMVLDGPFDGAQMQILRHVMLDVLRPLRLRPLPFNR